MPTFTELTSAVRRAHAAYDQAVEAGASAGDLDRLERDLRDAVAARDERLADVMDHLERVDDPPPAGGTGGSMDSTVADRAVLDREQRVADWVAGRGVAPDDQRDLSFGRWLRGISTGDWRDAERERRALSEGTLAGGGYTVPTVLSAELIDRARNVAAVFRAGARTVPMDSLTVNIARVAGDPTASWKAENAVITDSDMTFEQVTLKAKTLVSLTKASRELIEDSINAEEALRDAFAAQLAITLDKAALFGSGTDPEPRGVKNTTGVTKISAGANGGIITYDLLVDVVTTGWNSNEATAGAVILAPRTERGVLKLKDANNNPLTLPQTVADVPRYATNQVPVTETQGTATNASSVFGGDWSQMLVGVRHGLEIEVLRERYADAFQLGFLAHLRADVTLARPAAFTVLEGVTP
ncbi:MAG: phage major capsid protein [Actinobacteria bacterium]|nr:phage major capsid protein [Actinomycetota bacterium]